MRSYKIESGETGPDWLPTMPEGSNYYSQVIEDGCEPTMAQTFFAATPQDAFNKAIEYIAAQHKQEN